MPPITDLERCVANPKAILTKKIDKAPPAGRVRLSVRTPIKYHPGMCNSRNMADEIRLAIKGEYFFCKLPNIAPLNKNSSNIGCYH